MRNDQLQIFSFVILTLFALHMWVPIDTRKFGNAFLLRPAARVYVQMQLGNNLMLENGTELAIHLTETACP
jgi:hypothetical protein